MLALSERRRRRRLGMVWTAAVFRVVETAMAAAVVIATARMVDVAAPWAVVVRPAAAELAAGAARSEPAAAVAAPAAPPPPPAVAAVAARAYAPQRKGCRASRDLTRPRSICRTALPSRSALFWIFRHAESLRPSRVFRMHVAPPHGTILPLRPSSCLSGSLLGSPSLYDTQRTSIAHDTVTRPKYACTASFSIFSR